MSRPVTLLREPDQVYLLPLESSMKAYFNKALRWTYFSQVVLPLLLFIVAIPLLKTVTELSIQEIWIGVAFVAILKMFNVVLEFNYRYANRGHAVWIDNCGLPNL